MRGRFVSAPAGLRAGLADARADVVAGGATAIVVLPIDLPFVSVEAVDAVIDALVGAGAEPTDAARARPARTPTPRSCWSRTGTGPGPTRWGCGRPTSSASPSGRAAAPRIASARPAAGARYLELDGPLTVDLDTPEDLVFVESIAPERLGVG